ncbi:MAG: chitobiase/beta-hexosaminidase C-terminal domain-containing protein [Cyclobacteriaceae bacterium]
MKKKVPFNEDNLAPNRSSTYQLMMGLALWLTLLPLLTHAQNFGTPTRFEAENGFNSGVTTASVHPGFSGSGYVTGLTSAYAETKFYKGANESFPLTKLEIRYANGSGASVTNLALYIGSNHKVQDLVFPVTANWSTWSTITVIFNHSPNWGGDMRIVAMTSAATSANIDYTDVSVSDGTLQSVSTPTFSPTAGTYTSAQSVSISSATSGAAIHYTTNGSTPTTASPVYSAPIDVSSTQTIRALAVKSGMSNSSVASATYTINIPVVATPTFSPAAGTYSSAQSVTISTATSGATIHYTTNGSTPTTSSAVYTSPIAVSSTQTIRALAVKAGSTNSAIGSAAYTISTVAAAPTFSPAAGTYTSAQSVSISTTTPDATIRYTTDGSTPTTSSTIYSGPINVSSSMTLRAITIKSGLTNSAVSTAAYTINLAVATPTFSPSGGTFATAQSVSLSTTTPDAQIRYTVNGTTPTASSTLYTGPISVTSTQTIKAIALKSGFSNSAVATATYTISTGGGPGYVLREYWSGIPGTAISALTGNANFPNNPTSSSYLTSFDAPRDVADNYGQRISGYLTAPTTGSYKFWIAGDDDSELWLSTNSSSASKVKIASFTGWTNPLQFDKYGTQASANIDLVAGTQYYIEALHKENDGGDHLTVAWQIPGGSQVVIPGSALSTTLVVPIPQPGVFSQTAPATGATGVSTTPAFTWGASSDAVSYSLVVSTSASYANPVINVTGLTSTSYTPSTGLAGNTLYYWRVTAVNTSGTRVASNAGISFTTLVPPIPGTFTQTSPAGAATGVSTFPTFTWASASNAASYALVVSTNSSFTNPIINVSGLTALSYSSGTPLAVNTQYFWRVTATNATGSRIATNAGIAFTTASSSGTTYYVTLGGNNNTGNGTSGNPWRTVAYAASQVTAGTGNKTISVGPGTFVESQAIKLALGVNLVGAGESNTTITSNGPIPLDPGVDGSSNDFKLWHDGSLIQLASPIYTGPNPRYGSPAQMIAAANGTQTLSGFTLDGNNKTIKAGLWVLNRSNVTAHHITFRNFQQRGAVFTRGDMWWYEPIPDDKWMQNTTVYNCTFINSSADISGESTGNLCLGGLDGADIYNITINENQGYGIKFIHVGHMRNVKVHDCNITVPETDPDWGEDISIELWNFSYDNEIYNIVCNTWLSLVNHPQFDDYEPTPAKPSNLKVYNVRMIDGDGSSGKEAIECALSGVEIYNCYVQDKGFGVAIWGGSAWAGNIPIHDVVVRNNIFTNVNRPISYGFGNSAGVFIPDPANSIKIYNNVFDRMGNALQLNSATNVEVKNNAFLNSGGDDLQGGSNISFTHNLRFHTDPQRQNWVVSTTLGPGNIIGNPGFQNSGSRWDTYYKPSSSSSFVVDKGTNVGLPFVGSNPDIGRWEFGMSGGRVVAETSELPMELENGEKLFSLYPNPTTGNFTVTSFQDARILQVNVLTAQGKSVFTKAYDKVDEALINLSDFPNNFYIIQVNHEKGISTRKIVLMK